MIIDEKKPSTLVEFPKAHLDAAIKSAVEFNRNSLGTPSWRFDTHQGSHFDAAESAFVARQLEHIRAGVYEVEYPDLKGARLVPTNTSVPSGKNVYTIRIMDRVGEAKVIADEVTDIPNVEVSTHEATMRMFTLGIAYMYSLQEARAAMSEGMPLIAKKAMVAREMMERKLDTIILTGDTVAGVKGLLNATDTGIVTYSTPNGGAGDTEFSTKSSDEVLLDLHGAPAKVVTDSKEVDIPNTMLLPLSTKQYLTTRRVGDGTSVSIMSYFLGNDPYIDMVEGLYQLESSSDWTGKRGMCYRRDPNALELIVSQPFEQLPPQAQAMVVKTFCRMRTGGLAIYRPTSIVRFDQI